jgi:predicted AAA+ superfamily ATPase
MIVVDYAAMIRRHITGNLLQTLADTPAARAEGLLNFPDLSRTLALPQTTLKRYFALLEDSGGRLVGI